MSLYLDIYTTIALQNIETYRACLAIPIFARSTLIPSVNKMFRMHFTQRLQYDHFTEYRLNGRRHRDDGPAFIHQEGLQKYYQCGKRHRRDGPAIIYSNGDLKWCLHGIKHRIGGPAFIHGVRGIEYWENGMLHRVDGPACEYSHGLCKWYFEGKLIREEFIFVR